MKISTPKPEDNQDYWCKLKGKRFLSRLAKKRTDFYRWLETSRLFARIRRNYNMYHGLTNEITSLDNDYAIKLGGEHQDQFHIVINEFQPNIDLLVSYVTGGDIEWDTFARNDDVETEEATKLANHLLDAETSDVDKSLGERIKQTVLDGFVMSAGYLYSPWSKVAGGVDEAATQIDPMANGTKALQNQQLKYKGDIQYFNPGIFDVFYDFQQREFEDSAWVVVKKLENRWCLMEEYPKFKDQIRAMPAQSENRDFWKFDFAASGLANDEDCMWVYYFYHKKTIALPDGRQVRFVGNQILDDTKLETREPPVRRYVPNKYLLSSFGYTTAFNLQGCQEALNAAASTLVTNQNNLGYTKTWFKAGEKIGIADLEPGHTVIQTETPPQSINLLDTPPEILKAIEMWTMYHERGAGTNAAAKGFAGGANETGIGQAFKVQRAQQSVDRPAENYKAFLGRIGMTIVDTYRVHLHEPRPMAIIGDTKKKDVRYLDATALQPIEVVSAYLGQPGIRTPQEKFAYAQQMAGLGFLHTMEEFTTTMETGRVDRLLKGNEAQATKIHAENEAMLKGQQIFSFSKMDNHVLHAKEHEAELNSPEICTDPVVAPIIAAHNLLHIQAILDPQVQQLQVVLGYTLPPMIPGAQGMPMGQPGQGPMPMQGAPVAPGPMPIPEASKNGGAGGNIPPALQKRMNTTMAKLPKGPNGNS